jgi:hypothetical protein
MLSVGEFVKDKESLTARNDTFFSGCAEDSPATHARLVASLSCGFPGKTRPRGSSAHILCTAMLLRTQIFSAHDQALAAAIPATHDGARKFRGSSMQPLLSNCVFC